MHVFVTLPHSTEQRKRQQKRKLNEVDDEINYRSISARLLGGKHALPIVVTSHDRKDKNLKLD